jgi:hypothetical protein
MSEGNKGAGSSAAKRSMSRRVSASEDAELEERHENAEAGALAHSLGRPLN